MKQSLLHSLQRKLLLVGPKDFRRHRLKLKLHLISATTPAIDPVASHASWMENFPWTRLTKIEMPSRQKAMSDPEKLRRLDPKSVREHLNDGNYGGLYQRDDEEMMKIWQTAVEETRAILAEGRTGLDGG